MQEDIRPPIIDEKQQSLASPIEPVVMRPIANCEELAAVEENEKYRLEITPQDGNGWIRCKKTDHGEEYLSTHTFYGNCYKWSSKLLQKYGFNVQLKSWDA